MKRWLLVPLALAAALVATPASQGRGCKSYSCAPTYCVVGYKTDVCHVTSHEWITVKEKVKVTEYAPHKEKRTFTKYVQVNEVHKQPYTYYVDEWVKMSKDEKYTVCEPYTEVVEKPYTVHEPYTVEKTGTRKVSQTVVKEVPSSYTVYEEVRTEMKGTRKVATTVVKEEPRQYTVYEPVHTQHTGTKKVATTVVKEVPYSYTVDQGHWATQCYDQVCYSKKCGCEPCCHVVKCYKKVWVSNPVVMSGSRKVHECVWVDQPYTYTVVSHKPVIKEEKVKVAHCVWVDEPYTYTVVSCKPVVKQTTVKVHECVWVDQPYKYTEVHHKAVQKVEKVTMHKTRLVEKVRKVEYSVCNKKEMKGEHSYTVCKVVPQTYEADVEVLKPVIVEKEIDVKKCITVSKPVEVKTPIYGCVYNGCCK